MTEAIAQERLVANKAVGPETNAARAVVFDLYGTLADILVDEDRASFWNRLAASYFGAHDCAEGGELRRVYHSLMREQASHAVEGFLLDAVFEQLLVEFKVEPLAENLARFGAAFRRESTVALRKKDYSDALLTLLAVSGYKIGMVSNTEALLTAHDLEVLRLPDVFDSLVLSSAVGVKKPDRRIFEIALDELGVQPEQAVFIGNSYQDDALGARDAGLKAIFLTEEPLAAPCQSAGDDRLACPGFTLAEILAALASLGFPVRQTS